MPQSVKAVTALFVLVFLIASVVAWTDVAWTPVWKWALRFVFPATAAGVLVLLCWAEFRKDKAPDFLGKRSKVFFERKGFCFTLRTDREDDTCVLEMAFQNRFERACRARVAMKPSAGFFLTRPKIEGMALDVECGPAAFGVARAAFPVPRQYQGKEVSFDLGANVDYPHGRGRMLRYREGLTVGPARFSSYGGLLLTLIALPGGAVVISRPAHGSITLPMGVKEELPGDMPIKVETLWQLGDPDDVSRVKLPV